MPIIEGFAESTGRRPGGPLEGFTPTFVSGSQPKDPERTVLGTLGDVGVTALKGAVGLPQAFVGLADIPTGGRVGRALEGLGYRPEETQKILDTWYSDAQQAANAKVQQAEGFVPTLTTALQNPSTILTAAGESLPQMVGGAGIARGLLRVAPKLAPWKAAAAGEGILGAGAAASQIRAETPDGLLTPGQSAAAAASGLGTAVLGAAGSRLANRLGLGDVDTALAQGAMGVGKKGLLRNVGGSALSEGVFEELPQSIQEQVWQNVALGKPWDEGVGNAAAMGMLAGGLTGGGFGALNNRAVEADLLRREELRADQERLRGIARQEQERQLLEDEQLGGILNVRSRLPRAWRQFDIENVSDDISAQDVINRELGISPALAAKELEKQRKAREADILAAFNEPSGVRVAGADGQERELSAIEAALMQQGLPTVPTIETPAPAAPASRVYSPEEQELITMGVVPNGNALNLLGEIKASGLPMESLTPVITAMTERKNAQAKKLLAQAIIESKKAPAAAPAAPPVAPTAAPAPVVAAAAPPPSVAQAPGVSSLPVPEVPTDVQAPEAVQAEAQGEAPLAATAAQGAAPAAEPVTTEPIEPVVQRKRRVVNAAALQQSQAFVAPEVTEEQAQAEDPAQEAGLSFEDQLAAAQATGNAGEIQAEADELSGRRLDAPVAEVSEEERKAVVSEILNLRFADSKDPQRDAEIAQAYLTALRDAPTGSKVKVQEAIGEQFGIKPVAVRKIGNTTELVAAGKSLGYSQEQVLEMLGVNDNAKKASTAAAQDDATTPDIAGALKQVGVETDEGEGAGFGLDDDRAYTGAAFDSSGRPIYGDTDNARTELLHNNIVSLVEKIDRLKATAAELAAQGKPEVAAKIAQERERIEAALAKMLEKGAAQKKSTKAAAPAPAAGPLSEAAKAASAKFKAAKLDLNAMDDSELPALREGAARFNNKALMAQIDRRMGVEPTVVEDAPAQAKDESEDRLVLDREKAAAAWDRAADRSEGAIPSFEELTDEQQATFIGFGKNNWKLADINKFADDQGLVNEIAANDDRSDDPRPMRSPSVTNVDGDGNRFTSRPVAFSDLLTYDGIGRAVRHLAANGLADTITAVQDWYITDDPVGWDAVFAEIDGKPAVVFTSEALNDRARAAVSFVHEVGHAVDETHLGNWTFSSEPEFNLSLGKNGVRPMGAVAVELLEHFQNGDSALSQLLEYPLDLQGEVGTKASRVREELFAQVWAFSALADGMQFLRDNLPATAAFMESVHAQAQQTYAAQARANQGTQPGQVQGGRQGQGVSGARPSRQTQAGLSRLPAELQKPVGTITNVLNDTKNAALNMLTFTEDVINRAIDLGVESAGKLRTIYQERAALTGKLEREVERVADLYNQVPEAERGTGPRSVNQFLYDATREGKWGFKPAWRKGTSANVKVDPDMKQRYDALSKESKALVEAIFRHGDEVLSLKKQTVMAATDSEYDALIAAAQKANDTKKAARLSTDKADQIKRFNSLFALQEFRPYAPLKRFGDYVVIARSQKYLDADEKTRAKLENSGDDYHVSFAESAAAAREMVEQLQKQGAFAEVVFRRKEAVQQTMFGGMMSAFNKLRSELDSELADAQPGEKAALRAARKVIGELYLSSLAEASARKSEMRRRGVAGEIDMLRSFTSQGRADAQFIAGAKYNNQTLDVFNAMRREVKSGDAEEQNTKSGVFNELMKRHTQSMDYDPSPIADKLARTTSIWFLATSPAYYLQNLTQPFMMSMPFMTKRHNYLKIGTALLKAYSDLAPMFRTAKLGEQFNYGAAPQDVRNAISTLVDRGRIDIGMDTDLGTFRLEGEGPVKDRWNKVDRGIRSVSQKLEAVNRLATAIAAYRMELAKTGDTKGALDYADEVISQTHGDYTRTNAPRAFNTATGKVALQFRKFQLIQLTLLAKLIKNSFTGKDRAAAFTAMSFMLGHTAVMAGAIGLPGFAAISWALGALMGGGDDEPFNLEQWLREQTGNDQLSTLITRGAPAALGVDLSQKLGSGNVLSLLPFNDLDLSSRSGVESAAFAAFGGPAGGLTLRAVDGMSLMRDGQYYKGLEQLMPTGVTNAMKAYRTANEGVTRRNGDVLISPEEISGMETFWLGIGFQPTQIAERQFRDRVKREADDKFQSRAEKIRNAFLRAKDDPDARAEARERWMTLQDARESAGYRRQPLSSLMRAEQNQRERERNTLGGIQFNRDTRRFVEDLTQEQ